MTNKVTLIIIIISIAVLISVSFNGIKIGKYQFPSVEELIKKDETLQEKIDQANSLTSEKYSDNVKKLEDTFNNYLTKKQKYIELTAVTSNLQDGVYETKQYDIAYLWRVLGKYANNRGLTLGIDVQAADKTDSIYNLNFTVSGKYVNISQFITDIENDSDLYFRIYNFKMIGNNESVTSTFTVRNINIDSSTIK